jgi:methionyl-tRNA formyltransferase
MKICFLTKKEKLGVKEAIAITKNITKDIDVFYGDTTDPFPESVAKENYDVIISYISPWIVPKMVLDKTKKWNINFHPGPPEYPGIGCFNFAIYDSAKQFGVTAHIMESKVDTGEIIGVKHFSMAEEETVESLSLKTYSALLSHYKDIINYVMANDSLPHSGDTWERRPYKRSELEDLATIKTNMNEQEIEKRIRATYYHGKPAPFIELYGHKFEYNPDR